MRTLLIIGLICIIGVAGWIVYQHHSVQEFEKEISIGTEDIGVVETDDTEISETPTNIENVQQQESTKPPVPEKTDETESTSKEPTQKIAQTNAEPEEEKPSEMSEAEFQEIVDRAMTFEVEPEERDDLAEQLEAALTSKFGEHEQIPRFIDLWKNTTIILNLAEKAENVEDVTGLINMLPSVVLGEMVEISIDIAGDTATPEQIAQVRGYVEELKKEVDSLVLVESAVPLAEQAIRDGDISTEDAQAFIKEVSGHDVEFTILDE